METAKAASAYLDVRPPFTNVVPCAPPSAPLLSQLFGLNMPPAIFITASPMVLVWSVRARI
jgi:hypothetical protein